METQFCTRCGSKLASGAHYCASCGAQVRNSSTRTRNNPRGRKSKQKEGSRLTPKYVLFTVGLVILLVAGIFMLYNRSPAPPPAESIADYHNEEGIPYPEVPRIGPAEAKAALDAKTALIIDVRSWRAYDTAHVAKAISFPLADMETRYRELPQNMEIITYCA